MLHQKKAKKKHRMIRLFFKLAMVILAPQGEFKNMSAHPSWWDAQLATLFGKFEARGNYYEAECKI